MQKNEAQECTGQKWSSFGTNGGKPEKSVRALNFSALTFLKVAFDVRALNFSALTLSVLGNLVYIWNVTTPNFSAFANFGNFEDVNVRGNGEGAHAWRRQFVFYHEIFFERKLVCLWMQLIIIIHALKKPSNRNPFFGISQFTSKQMERALCIEEKEERKMWKEWR